MMKIFKPGLRLTALLLALAVAMTLVIAACGGDDEPDPTPAAPAIDMSAIGAMIGESTSGLSAEIRQAMAEEIAKIQPPLSEDEIRSLIESAVSESAPEGISSADIQAMVDSAVAAAAAEGVTQEDVSAAIGAALAAAAAGQAEPLSQADIERIVRAAVATPVPTPTAAPTAVPTPAPTPTAMAPRVPVSARLVLAVPPPSQEVGVMHLANNLTNSFLVHYDHLIASDPQTAAYSAQIATEWDTSPNGRVWTFKLRDDVPFYSRDGLPSGFNLTSEDVVFSFDLLTGVGTERAINPANWEGYAGRADNHKTNGDYEVIFDMDIVQLDLLTFMSDEVESGISSKAYWEAIGGEDAYNERPIGTGPFALLELNQGVNYLFARVEDHWRHTPYFHELEMKMIPESSTRLASLLTRESHLAVVPRGIHEQATAAGMSIYRASIPGGHYNMRLPWYKPDNYVRPDGSKAYSAGPEGPTKGYDPNDPLRDTRVRRALIMAMDRNEINDVFFQGRAIPNPMDYFPPWSDIFKDEWAPYPGPDGSTGAAGGWDHPHDVEGAKALLAEAGWPDGGFTVTIHVPNNHSLVPEMPDVAEQIGVYWSEIGVGTEFVSLTNQQVFATAWTREKPTAVYMNVSPKSAHPCVAMVFNRYESGRGFFDYDEVSEYKNRCDQMEDAEERRQLTLDFGDWWYERTVNFPILWVFQEGAYNPGVLEGYSVNLLHHAPVRYHEFTMPVYQ